MTIAVGDKIPECTMMVMGDGGPQGGHLCGSV